MMLTKVLWRPVEWRGVFHPRLKQPILASTCAASEMTPVSERTLDRLLEPMSRCGQLDVMRDLGSPLALIDQRAPRCSGPRPGLVRFLLGRDCRQHGLRASAGGSPACSNGPADNARLS